jgi:hypothetical protein
MTAQTKAMATTVQNIKFTDIGMIRKPGRLRRDQPDIRWWLTTQGAKANQQA